MSEVRLQVKNLCKNFGITKAVQNVSFNVNKGEVHALIGDCLLYTSDAADD